MAPVLAITGMVATGVEYDSSFDPVERFLNPSQPGRAWPIFQKRRTRMATGKMNRKQRKELARQLQSANPGWR